MSFSPPPGPAPQSHPGCGQAGTPGYGPPADIANWYAPWGTRVSATFIDGLISLLFTLPFEIAYLQGTTGATIGKKADGYPGGPGERRTGHRGSEWRPSAASRTFSTP
ncbi:hypothetical protein [Streptodolium elevatio]